MRLTRSRNEQSSVGSRCGQPSWVIRHSYNQAHQQCERFPAIESISLDVNARNGRHTVTRKVCNARSVLIQLDVSCETRRGKRLTTVSFPARCIPLFDIPLELGHAVLLGLDRTSIEQVERGRNDF